MGQENFRILVGLWAKGLLAKFQQSPTKSHWHISSFSSKTLFIYRCLVETVKLNFHLEIYATLDHNLNSGLCLELQVFCETSFTQILDRYWAAARLPRGWSVYVVLQGLFHEFIREHPILTDCDVNSQIHIGVFLRRCSAGQHLCLPE
jgi:hypothetical protein